MVVGFLSFSHQCVDLLLVGNQTEKNYPKQNNLKCGPLLIRLDFIDCKELYKATNKNCKKEKKKENT